MPRDRADLVEEDEEESESETTEPEKSEVESSTATPEPSSNEQEIGARDNQAHNSEGAGETEAEAEEVNIREDWDGSTYYIKPEQADKLDDEFRTLKRQMKREEDVIVEKHKHFFRAVLDVSVEENLDRVLERAQELAKEDAGQSP
jgi:hypothetical protein